MSEAATVGGLPVVELAADDPEDFDAVWAELRGLPGVEMTPVSTPIKPGEQGAGTVELLTVACTSGALPGLFQLLRALAESRGPRFSLKIRQGKTRLELKARNVDEVLSALRDLLDGS